NFLTYAAHTNQVNALAWSPDTYTMATASDDGTMKVWNVTDRSDVRTYKGHTDAVTAVAWSHNGHYVVSGEKNGIVHVWSKASTRRTSSIHRGHAAQVTALAWSDDMQYIASGHSDGVVQVWKVNKEQPIFTYKGHS